LWFSFSNLRPANDTVKSTNKCAGGPIEFIKIFDRALDVIRQGGVRHGANIAVLRCDHPDLMDFIKLKKTEGVVPNLIYLSELLMILCLLLRMTDYIS